MAVKTLTDAVVQPRLLLMAMATLQLAVLGDAGVDGGVLWTEDKIVSCGQIWKTHLTTHVFQAEVIHDTPGQIFSCCQIAAADAQ